MFPIEESQQYNDTMQNETYFFLKLTLKKISYKLVAKVHSDFCQGQFYNIVAFILPFKQYISKYKDYYQNSI